MENNSFTKEELEIINLYLEERKSIRELAELNRCGRPKIRKILANYADISDEKRREIEQRKALSKNNRKKQTNVGEISENLSELQIKSAYLAVMKREKSLTQLAEELGKGYDTLKRAIIKYLNDENKIKQFKETLRENQTKTQTKYFDSFNDKAFCELPDVIKKEKIFEKLKAHRRISGKKAYSEELLEDKYNRLMNFFLKRNGRIEKDEDKISKEKLQKMMFDAPNLLTLSLVNKVKPVTDMLDFEFGFSNSSYILEENPVILSSSLARARLQVRILRDTNTTKYALEKPRNFRTSPELMYALIKKWELEGRVKSPFIETQKVYKMYGETSKSLQAKYDVRDEYGDDEYFDRR